MALQVTKPVGTAKKLVTLDEIARLDDPELKATFEALAKGKTELAIADIQSAFEAAGKDVRAPLQRLLSASNMIGNALTNAGGAAGGVRAHKARTIDPASINDDPENRR